MEKVPADLRKALAASPKANAAWKDITPIARRDFVTWIESAKQEETRKRRIEKACDMLIKGKRRPCCYSPVPLDLYSALSTTPKAKATWKSLTPDERRDLVSWIEAGKDRAGKAIKLLAAGKRRA